MPSGSGREKLNIRNSLYRRYINSNRGFTPRSLKTSGVSYTLTSSNNFNFKYFRLSSKLSRIYRIKNKDYIFDHYRMNVNNDEIQTLARSLNPLGICIVRRYDNEVYYHYPYNSALDVELTGYKEGFYYRNNTWYYSEAYDEDVDFIVKVDEDFINAYFLDTDTNEIASINIGTTHFSPVTDTYTPSEGEKFIFIPVDSESTVLQAYLPLLLNPSGKIELLGKLYNDVQKVRIEDQNNKVLWARGGRNNSAFTISLSVARNSLQPPSGATVYIGFGPKIEGKEPESTAGIYNRYFYEGLDTSPFLSNGNNLYNIYYPADLGTLPITYVNGLFNNIYWTLSGKVNLAVPAYPMTVKVYYSIFSPTIGNYVVEIPDFLFTFLNSINIPDVRVSNSTSIIDSILAIPVGSDAPVLSIF